MLLGQEDRSQGVGMAMGVTFHLSLGSSCYTEKSGATKADSEIYRPVRVRPNVRPTAGALWSCFRA